MINIILTGRKECDNYLSTDSSLVGVALFPSIFFYDYALSESVLLVSRSGLVEEDVV